MKFPSLSQTEVEEFLKGKKIFKVDTGDDDTDVVMTANDVNDAVTKLTAARDGNPPPKHWQIEEAYCLDYYDEIRRKITDKLWEIYDNDNLVLKEGDGEFWLIINDGELEITRRENPKGVKITIYSDSLYYPDEDANHLEFEKDESYAYLEKYQDEIVNELIEKNF